MRLFENLLSNLSSRPPRERLRLSVDIDSTLADTRHRQWIVREARSRGEEPDWEAYALASLQDTPTPLAELLVALTEADCVTVFPISWRPDTDKVLEATTRWLGAVAGFRRLGMPPILADPQRMHEDHIEWKVSTVADLAVTVGTSYHIDDYSSVAEALNAMPDSPIRGITVTPPGMVAKWPTQK